MKIRTGAPPHSPSMPWHNHRKWLCSIMAQTQPTIRVATPNKDLATSCAAHTAILVFFERARKAATSHLGSHQHGVSAASCHVSNKDLCWLFHETETHNKTGGMMSLTCCKYLSFFCAFHYALKEFSNPSKLLAFDPFIFGKTVGSGAKTSR